MHFPVLHSMLGNYNDISLTRGSQQWFVKSQTKILPGYPHALFVKHTKRLLTFQAKPFCSPGYKSVQIQTVITQWLHIVRVTLFSHYPITCHIYQVLLNVRIKVKKKVTLRIASLGHLLMSLLIFKFVRKRRKIIFSGCKSMSLWLPWKAEIGICHCSRSQTGNPPRHWPDMLCWNCSQ